MGWDEMAPGSQSPNLGSGMRQYLVCPSCKRGFFRRRLRISAENREANCRVNSQHD